jgi:hypothetical protein
MLLQQTEKQISNTQGWKNIIKIIIPYFLVIGTLQLIGFLLLGIKTNVLNPTMTTFQQFIISALGLIGTIIILYFFMKYIDKKAFISVGLQKDFILRNIGLGFTLGFILIFMGFFILWITKQITIINIQFNFFEFALSFALFIVVALTEELFLRGYILNNLMVSFNKNIALFISSVMFSLIHLPNQHFNYVTFLVIIIAGLLLGLTYIYTQNLWFSIALHFSWNFFQGTIFGFNVSGQKVYSLIEIQISDNNIWNGGEFGFEGSILSIIFQIMALIIVYKVFKK